MNVVNEESVPVNFDSLIDLVEYQAEHLPDNVVYQYLKDGEVLDASLTFSEFSHRVQNLAAIIQTRCIFGDRVLLLYPSSLDYIVAFFACLYAGVIAVPAYPPQNQRRDWTRLQCILEDSKASLLLSTDQYFKGIEQWLSLSKLSYSPQVLASNSILNDKTYIWHRPAITCDSIAFLQYSSGSTGMPKGVMVSHENLLHNEKLIQQSMHSCIGSKFVGWLPIYHDMGLIGNVMQPLYCGGELTILSPASVIQKPFRWLKAISDRKALISGGPNFIYDLCVQHVTEEQKKSLDLSHWGVAFNGAEPISSETLMRFCDYFYSCGFNPEAFSPCYGLAENTLMTSCKSVRQKPKILYVNAEQLKLHKALEVDEHSNHSDSIALVSSGDNIIDQKIRIANVDTHVACADGEVGEIWIKGKSVAKGYWNKPDINEGTFHAHIIENNIDDRHRIEKTEGPFLRTGDYGFFYEKNLYVTGRIKELIIVHGQNHYPQDIEKTVQNVSGYFRKGGGAAFSINVDGQERLVVVQELTREGMRARNKDQVRLAIPLTQTTIAELHQLKLHDFVLVKYGSIAKTTSGKIQRYMNRQRYSNGEFPALYTLLNNHNSNLSQTCPHHSYVAPASRIEEILCNVWQEVLAIPKVGTADNFFQLGGHSLLIIQVIGKLQDRNLPVSMQQLFDAQTLAELAISIEQRKLQESNSLEKNKENIFSVPDNLIPFRCENITPEMLPLVKLNEKEIEYIVGQIEGGAENIQDIYPLSPIQEGILFHHRMSFQNDPYVLPTLFSVADIDAFNRLIECLRFIVDRHDALRTAVLWDSLSVPVQVVYRKATLPVTWLKLSTEHDVKKQMLDLCSIDNQHMMIQQAPLFKIDVAKDPQSKRHFIILKFHHIISDHTGLEIIQRELNFVQRGLADVLEQPRAYREFVAHAHNQVKDNCAEQYFKQLLSDIDEPTLPFGLSNIQSDGSQITEVRGRIEKDTAEKIRTVAKTLLLSPASLFHTAWAMVISACSGQDDIVFGTVLSGRLMGNTGAEHSVGVFVNTLPVRIKLSTSNTSNNNNSIESVVKQTHQHLRQLLQFEQMPLTQALACSGLSSDVPLFSALLNYRHSYSQTSSVQVSANKQGEEEGNQAFIEFIHTHERTNYPFSLSVDDSDAFGFELNVQVDYSVNAERVLAYVQTAIAILVERLTNSPSSAICDLSTIPGDEYHQLTEGYQSNSTDYRIDQCIHEFFEAQAAKLPNTTALVLGDQKLTYKELNTRANQLAHHLRDVYTITPNTLIGLCVERSFDMIVGVLGILKAGGAYLPLDPNYPRARFSHIFNDAKLDIVLTHKKISTSELISFLDSSNNGEIQTIFLDDESVASRLLSYSGENILPETIGLSATNRAYVIYTSGSTGNPKGVIQTHQTVSNLVQGIDVLDNVCESMLTLQFASNCFDVSVQEMATAWYTGSTLFLISDEDKANLVSLPGIIANYKLERIFLPPAVLQWFSENAGQHQLSYPHLKQVFVAGEALLLSSEIKTFFQVHPHCRLWNHYGPTETHVATRACVDIGKASVSIGSPLPNVSVFVLDKNQNVAPLSVPGELYIGGVGLAQGYLNRSDLTADKFIHYSVGKNGDRKPKERLYKTGDVVRWSGDGNLEFIGRADNQVKIRGFRVELGEVEHVLMSQLNLSEVVVTLSESGVGNGNLIAYVVTQENNIEIDRWTLKTQETLRKILPEYMVPVAFVILESLPLTANGKVDRSALPEADVSLRLSEHVEASTDTEKALCELWQSILEIEVVGIKDNFFHIGGHSLLATRLIANVNNTFQKNLPLVSLFDNPTPERLAKIITETNFDSLELDSLKIIQTPRDGLLPVSYAQQRLWLLDKIDNGSQHYNMSGVFNLSGNFNHDALNHAFSRVVERHESLRTCFVEDEQGQPLQSIITAAGFNAPLIDLSTMAADKQELEKQALINQEASDGFDLAGDVMLRAKVIKLAQEQYTLLVTLHHIASDGWSMPILMKEFVTFYHAHVNAVQPVLPSLIIQYADYAFWQRNWLQGNVLNQQMSYWQKKLADLPVVHNVPLDFTRPKIQTFSGSSYHSNIDNETCYGLHEVCRSSDVTLFMGLHAVFSVLLSRYSRQTDIVMGTPIANREQIEVEGLIGFFVNNLVLRCDLSKELSFEQLLEQSKKTLLDAYAHQQVPFEKIIDCLQPQRSTSHTPLFQIMLVLQNNQQESLVLPDLTLEQVQPKTLYTKYDITLNVEERDNELLLMWEYNTDLFSENSITGLARHFGQLLKSLVDQPKESVLSAQMVTDAEKQQLLGQAGEVEFTTEKYGCIHQVFESQAQQYPDAIAVEYQEQHMTYKELNAAANQLAYYLVEQRKVKTDTLVGICVDRSLNMVIGILAILKAGGAYVPIDPNYPETRIGYMLRDANITTVLTQINFIEMTPITKEQAICLDSEYIQQQLKNYPTENAEQPALLKQLAYINYTSGSTGQPKGVMIEHKSVINLVKDSNYVSFTKGDVVAQASNMSFDALTFELWGSLLNGAKLVYFPTETLIHLSGFEKTLIDTEINTMFVTVALFNAISQEFPSAFSSIKTLLFGGDDCSLKEVKNVVINGKPERLLNGYGPTECTTFSVWKEITSSYIEKAKKIALGRPLTNTQTYVLDEYSNIVPVGVPGELYLSGPGLARGYLNRPDLTVEKFIDNPFYKEGSPESYKRIYRTGDLVRWLPDGDLEFLGRVDNQVKVRGFRIEPGEIEAALVNISEVNDAVVVVNTSPDGGKSLVAYIIPSHTLVEKSEERNLQISEFIDMVRKKLHTVLPEYTVPEVFSLLDVFPLTSNGKVDRKNLPEPDLSLTQTAYIAPNGDTEQDLCVIWQDVLGVECVGMMDNFFSLGGNSLLAARLVSRIKNHFQVDFPLSTFFSLSSIKDLAIAIDQQESKMTDDTFDRMSGLLDELEV